MLSLRKYIDSLWFDLISLACSIKDWKVAGATLILRNSSAVSFVLQCHCLSSPLLVRSLGDAHLPTQIFHSEKKRNNFHPHPPTFTWTDPWPNTTRATDTGSHRHPVPQSQLLKARVLTSIVGWSKLVVQRSRSAPANNPKPRRVALLPSWL